MARQYQPVLRVNGEGASSILLLGTFSMDILMFKSGKFTLISFSEGMDPKKEV